MITSLLDNDLYKLTMMQAVYHQQPTVVVKYEFKCRNKGIDFKPFIEFIKAEIESYRQLKFNTDELNYLKSLQFIREDFVNYLFIYRNNANSVDIYIDKDNDLHIDVHGTWLNTILLEVPILAIVNEVYFNNGKTKDEIDALEKEGTIRLERKIEALKKADILESTGIRFMEFGTRRRRYQSWQKFVVKQFVENTPKSIIGTSNILLAKQFNIKPIGTHAHEWFMAHQALVRIQDSQRVALQRWQEEYRGHLGIALGDTLGLDAFLKDFDLYFAKLYDGVRQDSGDPEEFHNKLAAHCLKLGVDPKTKTIIFSDNLTIYSAMELKERINKHPTPMNVLFGIGTSLTNDFGDEPLQIVMKLTECNGQPVAKISEAKGKTMCNDPIYLQYLKSAFHIKD